MLYWLHSIGASVPYMLPKLQLEVMLCAGATCAQLLIGTMI